MYLTDRVIYLSINRTTKQDNYRSYDLSAHDTIVRTANHEDNTID